MMFLDSYYLYYILMVSPALLLAFWAQMRVHATYAEAQQLPASLSGAAAARHVLDSAGLRDVEIEQVPGQLTDHYDPRDKVLRLSQDVYQSRSLAAIGIAAHEAGHAIQDAHGYAPLAIRNAAVPVANFGSGFSMVLFILGLLVQVPALMWGGILLFGGVVFFQLVNLPVEFNASSRAKDQLTVLGIANREEMVYVNRVLNAAAWTYVAGTLHAVLTLLYLVARAGGQSRD
ncbi:MAG: zinc metallopeptidase [Planctomycetia bacterium]|nr:zinc metallopeptidase [Planctomycetia bacterium]